MLSLHTRIKTSEYGAEASPKAKKYRSQLLAENVMVTAFIEYHGMLLLDLKKPGVNAERAGR